MAQQPTSVIVDCDPGNDDIWGIIALLKCEEKCNLKVKAITVCNGNTTVDHGCRNALLTLKHLNRLDVPVFRGAESSLIVKPDFKPSFHGNDGLRDVHNDKPSLDLVQKKHAVEALRDYINELPHEIILFAVGPLTNIALLYKLNPGISSKIKELHVMGGNYKGNGNISRAAEFNFWSDPEAAHIVLAESKCPITIFPWESCLDASTATPMVDWRMNVLGKLDSVVTNFLNPVDVNCAVRGNWIPCDCYLMVCFLLPRLIKKVEDYHVTVELAGNYARGQMIIDHLKREKPNARVIEEIDAELFKELMMWICGDGSHFKF